MSQPEESGLERDYCAGQLSLREMAKIYGISEAAIRKRAKSMVGYAVRKLVRKGSRFSATTEMALDCHLGHLVYIAVPVMRMAYYPSIHSPAL